jgi:hypothetical protein
LTASSFIAPPELGPSPIFLPELQNGVAIEVFDFGGLADHFGSAARTAAAWANIWQQISTVAVTARLVISAIVRTND